MSAFAQLTNLMERAGTPGQPIAPDWPNLRQLHQAVTSIPFSLLSGWLNLKTATDRLRACFPDCGVQAPDADIAISGGNGLVFALSHTPRAGQAALTLLRVDPDSRSGRPPVRIIGVTAASSVCNGDEIWPQLKLAVSRVSDKPPVTIKPLHQKEVDDKLFDLIYPYPDGPADPAVTELVNSFLDNPRTSVTSYITSPTRYLSYWARTPNRVLVVPAGRAHVSWFAPVLAYAATLDAEVMYLRPGKQLEPWEPRLDFPERSLIDPLVFVRRPLVEPFLAQIDT